MTSFKRIRLAALVLGAALLAQGGLLAHMMLGPANVYPELRKPFSTLPQTIEVALAAGKPPLVWDYVPSPEQSLIPTKIPFKPIDLSYRNVKSRELGIDARCYVVHAESGEDRQHHPEICIRDVQQIPESVGDRKLVTLGGDDKRQIQRYVFQQGHGAKTAVYYWYYVFKPITQPNQSWMQSLYHSFNRMPPSVTVEVIATAPEEKWAEIESKLLAPLDKTLRAECLPANVQMGCERLPMGLTTK